MKSFGLMLITSLTVLSPATGAFAQNYPARSVTMVIPYAPGGPLDTIARLLAEPMRASLGQPVTIEYISGAAGSVGTGRVARANADGYTIIIGNWGTHVVNGAVQRLQYDLLADFEPVGLISKNPIVIVSRSDVPANNLKEFIAWVQVNQAKLSAANAGIGSPGHISGLYFQSKTGTRFPFVPYRGSGPILQDLIGGKIDLFFDLVSNSLPHLRSGRIKAYAVATKSRLPAVPELPSVDEAGLPGFHMSVWQAVWAPKGTPKDIVDKLNRALVHALNDPKTQQVLRDLGQKIASGDQQSPEALAVLQKAEIEKWWPIIKAANIKSE
jgi:tripartite-type tricarboxylate transporter receptor subunit TctC